MALFLKRNTRSKFGLSIWQSCANTLRMLPEHSLPMVTPPWPSFMMQFCTIRLSLGAGRRGRCAMRPLLMAVHLAILREHVADVAGTFAAHGDAAVAVLHDAVLHDEVLAWRVQAAAVGVAPALDGDAIVAGIEGAAVDQHRSEEHTSELQ